MSQFSPGDRVALAYLVVAGIILLFQWDQGFDYRYEATVNLILAMVITWTAIRPLPTRFLRVVRDLYPLVFIGSAFVQVGFFARMIYGDGFTFDPLVAAWDAWFFGSNPHVWFHTLLPGRLWAEIMHLLYSLYFPFLGVTMLYVRLRRPWDFSRFTFVFLCSFLSFVAIFIAFPATGPLEYREGLFGAEVLGAQFIDYLFSFGIPDPGGAFPSSHVGQSVVIYLLLRPMTRGPRLASIAVILGIGISMTHISVHYAIDAVAGVPSGIVLYYVWTGVYARVSRKSEPETLQNVESSRRKLRLGNVMGNSSVVRDAPSRATLQKKDSKRLWTRTRTYE